MKMSQQQRPISMTFFLPMQLLRWRCLSRSISFSVWGKFACQLISAVSVSVSPLTVFFPQFVSLTSNAESASASSSPC